MVFRFLSPDRSPILGGLDQERDLPMLPHEVIASQSTQEEGDLFKVAFEHMCQPVARAGEPGFIFGLARSDATKPDGFTGTLLKQTREQMIQAMAQPAAAGYALAPEADLRSHLTRFAEAYFTAQEGYYKRQSLVAALTTMAYLEARNSEGMEPIGADRERIMLAYYIPAERMKDRTHTVFFAVSSRPRIAPN